MLGKETGFRIGRSHQCVPLDPPIVFDTQRSYSTQSLELFAIILVNAGWQGPSSLSNLYAVTMWCME